MVSGPPVPPRTTDRIPLSPPLWVPIDRRRPPPRPKSPAFERYTGTDAWTIRRDSAGLLFFHAAGASEPYQGRLTVLPDDRLVISALSNAWGINSRAAGCTPQMHIAIAAAVLGLSRGRTGRTVAS